MHCKEVTKESDTTDRLSLNFPPNNGLFTRKHENKVQISLIYIILSNTKPKTKTKQTKVH